MSVDLSLFDDPADDSDSADVPKVTYAAPVVLRTTGPDGSTVEYPPLIIGAGIYGDPTTVGERMRTFVPVVLSTPGRKGSFFTSEVTLTNRGRQEATLHYSYSELMVTNFSGEAKAVSFSVAGEAPASFELPLAPGQQHLIPDALEAARQQFGIDLPINSILADYAPGVMQGYVRVRKTSGNNPFLAYGVIHDGGVRMERSDDGAYIPATRPTPNSMNHKLAQSSSKNPMPSIYLHIGLVKCIRMKARQNFRACLFRTRENGNR